MQIPLSSADLELLQRQWTRVTARMRENDIEYLRAWLVESAPLPLRHLFGELPISPDNCLLPGVAKRDSVEEHLASRRPASRKARGAWFTPFELAHYLVSRTDAHLKTQLNSAQGWLSEEVASSLVVWDPAMGAGVFQVALMTDACKFWDASPTKPHRDWSAFVNRCVLPRLWGCDIEPLSLAVACVRLVEVLHGTLYDFAEPVPLQWRLGDAFDEREPIHPDGTLVVIGNPPYGSLSRPTDGWIEGLIRGDQWPRHASYRHVNGQPIAERKSWLHDDYVKFFRLAQWQVEHAKNGIVAFVTNHGFLDNAGFRGMREALTTAFDWIEFLDLHGNTNKKETAQNGERDENVFAITTGVALSILSRTGQNLPSKICIGDLRGSANAKRHQLEAATLEGRSLSPLEVDLSSTQHRFTSERHQPPPKWYQCGVRIVDLMPVSTTAPVTARDYFVVDIDRTALEARLEAFADLSRPDEEIRATWFQRTRSPRYPTGDTRGWKLAEARRRFAADPNWRSCIRRVQYRPLDERWIAWHEELIDWPRSQAVKHFLDRPNIVLITRRQGLPDQPYTFFWVTDKLAIDGILRSDNKGSESLFPLWLYDEQGHARPNISPTVLDRWERRLGQFSFSGPTKNYLSLRLNEKNLVGWLYAWFFSATYRREAIDALRMDFPRIPIPKTGDIFLEFSDLGWDLLTLHLETATSPRHPIPDGPVRNPQWRDGKVLLDRNDPQSVIAEAPELVWNYRVGSHQPAKKWIAERRGLRWTAEFHAAYKHLIRLLTETLDVEMAIERFIARHGGISGCCAES